MEKAELQGYHQAIQQWYQKHGRHHLPWRNTNSAYEIWLSEVMLQQTQVQTVLDRFYHPFLKDFPSLEALAAADSQQVLKRWEGLGYYNRARNLHKAAQIAVEQGGLPDTVEGLIALPGIGQNTAHAIAAFAYHQPVAILEANVKRVVARILALETPTDKELWAAAESLADSQQPFNYNQAMMDIGSQICTPTTPQCMLCPAADICQGKGYPQLYPQKKKKKAVPIRKQTIVLFQEAKGRYYIAPRTGKFLHGLWEFPTIDAAQKTIEQLGNEYIVTKMRHLGHVTHAYSHFILEAEIYLQTLPDYHANDDTRWKRASEISDLPLSRTEKKILKLL